MVDIVERLRWDAQPAGATDGHGYQPNHNCAEAADVIVSLRAEVEKLETEAGTALGDVDRMQNWVNDLQSGMYINCVYCGHRYGPSDEIPVMRDALKEHIEQCPEHPIAQALDVENEDLKAEIEKLKKVAKAAEEIGLEYTGNIPFIGGLARLREALKALEVSDEC